MCILLLVIIAIIISKSKVMIGDLIITNKNK